MLETPEVIREALANARRAIAEAREAGKDLAGLERTLALTLPEVWAWQNAQSSAFATGRISQDVATYLYRAIGEGSDWPKGTDLATKVVVTEIMALLLGRAS